MRIRRRSGSRAMVMRRRVRVVAGGAGYLLCPMCDSRGLGDGINPPRRKVQMAQLLLPRPRNSRQGMGLSGSATSPPSLLHCFAYHCDTTITTLLTNNPTNPRARPGYERRRRRRTRRNETKRKYQHRLVADSTLPLYPYRILECSSEAGPALGAWAGWMDVGFVVIFISFSYKFFETHLPGLQSREEGM